MSPLSKLPFVTSELYTAYYMLKKILFLLPAPLFTGIPSSSLHITTLLFNELIILSPFQTSVPSQFQWWLHLFNHLPCKKSQCHCQQLLFFYTLSHHIVSGSSLPMPFNHPLFSSDHLRFIWSPKEPSYGFLSASLAHAEIAPSHSLLEVELCLPKKGVEILTLSTCECDLFQK